MNLLLNFKLLKKNELQKFMFKITFGTIIYFVILKYTIATFINPLLTYYVLYRIPTYCMKCTIFILNKTVVKYIKLIVLWCTENIVKLYLFIIIMLGKNQQILF